MAASYEIATRTKPRSIIDGDMRKRVQVTVTRYDKPTSNGTKVGTDTVKAWRVTDATKAAIERGHDIVRRDQRKRASAIRGKIDRLTGE